MKHASDYKHAPRTMKLESTLADALKKILDEKKSRILVTENDKVTGIVTEKDLGIFLLTDDTERNLSDIPLSTIVQKIISVDEHTSMIECAEIMLTKSIGSLVITSNDEVVGIITKTDLVRYFTKMHPDEKLVGEYMSPYYAWQYSDTPLYKIVLKMIDEKISRIIIRNRKDVPVGIITFRDLFALALKQGNFEDVLDNTDPVISVIFPRKGFISESGFGASVNVEDIMSKDIVSVNYDDDLANTGNLLLEKNINGVGVLSQHGNIVGILSKTDIVKAIAFLK
ncbi:CBS domain-containing protein [Nitrosopumilus maritimus]|uniref:Signal transduction protein with CBS domains n=1 Tax=Nitrosopumilus maritimus (strain SCM1) TaxID=436308 RepID=A9A4S3_NITMS|nr:CBS domain-containing protein [Nitrosopumilus maritimus]ABX13377.1 putative signal transduction protein with CBS domains [Nitrosopumilus maritimus SCM1]